MGIWRRRHQRWQLSKIWKETCGSAHTLRPHATHVQCARGQRKPLSEKELLALALSALEAENISKQRSHTSRPTPSGKMLEKLNAAGICMEAEYAGKLQANEAVQKPQFQPQAGAGLR